MKYLMIVIMAISLNGCVHDDVTPQEASRMTTTDLQYIYGSYRYNKDKLPNIRNELIGRGAL